MTLSRFILLFCLAFVGGILLSSFIKVPITIILGLFIFGIAVGGVFWRSKYAVILGFCFLFAGLGMLRYSIQEQQFLNDGLAGMYNDMGQKITISGVIYGEPHIKDTNIRFNFRVEKIHTNNGWKNIGGRILVVAPRYPEYKYGDKLEMSGVLQTPSESADFNYRDYLKKDGIYSIVYRPEIKVQERGRYKTINSVMYANILKFKEVLRENIYRNLSPPQSSILAAMLWGDQRQVSEEWSQKMNVAGVRHITAVSGQNITILTGILMAVFIGLGLWRQQAFYLTLVLITVFIIMTGLQASAIRAGIMGSLFLLAQHAGRINASSRAIVFAATGMLAVNPMLLRLDAGFQLSFMAMLGIIYLYPILQDKLSVVPDTFQLRSILTMTVSASVFTLPILIYNFSYVSVVGIPANILIVPLVPLIMISGFLFSIAGVLWQPLGWIISWPVWLLLTYIIRATEWFSGLSFAALTIKISWIWLLALYLALGFYIFKVHRERRLKFLDQ